VTPDVRDAIERDLASSDEDTQWQAAIRLGDYIEHHPEAVWLVLARWGCSDDGDTRMAMATCVLEHLLEHHFATFFPRVEELSKLNMNFGDTVRSAWFFGQSEEPVKRVRLQALQLALSGGPEPDEDESEEG
jgi:hypothetical protein